MDYEDWPEEEVPDCKRCVSYKKSDNNDWLCSLCESEIEAVKYFLSLEKKGLLSEYKYWIIATYPKYENLIANLGEEKKFIPLFDSMQEARKYFW